MKIKHGIEMIAVLHATAASIYWGGVYVSSELLVGYAGECYKWDGYNLFLICIWNGS